MAPGWVWLTYVLSRRKQKDMEIWALHILYQLTPSVKEVSRDSPLSNRQMFQHNAQENILLKHQTIPWDQMITYCLIFVWYLFFIPKVTITNLKRRMLKIMPSWEKPQCSLWHKPYQMTINTDALLTTKGHQKVNGIGPIIQMVTCWIFKPPYMAAIISLYPSLRT